MVIAKVMISEVESLFHIWWFGFESQCFCLTPNCLGPRFCLFLKFGQAIVIKVLMLNFLSFLY